MAFRQLGIGGLAHLNEWGKRDQVVLDVQEEYLRISHKKLAETLEYLLKKIARNFGASIIFDGREGRG